MKLTKRFLIQIYIGNTKWRFEIILNNNMPLK